MKAVDFIARFAIPVLLGGGAGLLVTVLSSRPTATPATGSPVIRTSSVRQSSPQGDVNEKAHDPSGPSLPAVPPWLADAGELAGNLPQSVGSSDVSMEEWREHHRQRYASRLAAHSAEPLDPGWSAPASQTLERDLQKLDGDFTPIKVQCRTNSCSAVLEWDSYASAVASYDRILHGDHELNCGRSILLPEPDDPLAKYQATAIFDCEEFRFGDDPAMRKR